MKNTLAKLSGSIRVAVVLFAMMAISDSCDDSAGDRQEIKAVWANYIAAFRNNMGPECAKYVDTTTINYYTHLLQLIRSVDSVTLEHLRLDQKLMVLTARLELPVQKILKMDGLEYFKYCVQTGTGRGYDGKKYLNIISVNHSSAKTEFVDSSGKGPLPIDFVKENGRWKINITTALADVSKDTWDDILRDKLKETGQTEREYIYSFLEDISHIKPTNSIWHPCCP
jgi:hypothetical protein